MSDIRAKDDRGAAEASGASFELNVKDATAGSIGVGPNATAITIVNQGLSFTETEKLFGLLFEQNFPRLAEVARAEAWFHSLRRGQLNQYANK